MQKIFTMFTKKNKQKMNNMPYGIPLKDEEEIRARDKTCVYCQKKMISPWDSKNSKDSATIEHLNHKPEWDSVRSFVREGKSVSTIVAICCGSCNSRRSSKSLSDWFNADYCKNRNINYSTVSKVVKNYIDNYEK